VINADPKLLSRVGRHTERVLIADPHPAAGKLLSDLVKDMGARHVMLARDTVRAAEIAREFDPQLIFLELSSAEFDGLGLARALRRSDYVCRKAPIIMVTAEPTVETIKAARDAGVHEFLRKPFTTRDLFRRVEAAVLKPRLWIEAKMYVGPDRRRFNSAEAPSNGRRRSDQMEAARFKETGAFEGTLAAITAALNVFETRPQAALRILLEQAAELQSAAFHHADPDMTSVVGSLQRYLLQALEGGRLSRKTVQDHGELVVLFSRAEGPAPEERRRMARELATRAAAEQTTELAA
jgi:DNA-binding response OmpR family regulator